MQQRIILMLLMLSHGYLIQHESCKLPGEVKRWGTSEGISHLFGLANQKRSYIPQPVYYIIVADVMKKFLQEFYIICKCQMMFYFQFMLLLHIAAFKLNSLLCKLYCATCIILTPLVDFIYLNPNQTKYDKRKWEIYLKAWKSPKFMCEVFSDTNSFIK